MNRSCRAALFAEAIVFGHLRREATSGIGKIMPGGNIEPMKIQEESMTEDMLLRLCNHYSDVVDVITFDRIVEGRETGADWLWWFDTPSGSHAMLIQAKRTVEHMSRFHGRWEIRRSSDRNSVTDKTQHKALLDAGENLRVKPFYAIYAPVLRLHSCKQLEELAVEWFPFLDFPHPLWHRWTSISIVDATVQPPTGNLSIDPFSPPGVSLAYFICCLLPSGGAPDKENYEKFSSPAPEGKTFEDIVTQIAEQAAVTNRIAGATRVKVTPE